MLSDSGIGTRAGLQYVRASHISTDKLHSSTAKAFVKIKIKYFFVCKMYMI